MIGAGLVAKKAVEQGLTRKPWVKTSLAPGSKVVTDYLNEAGPQTLSRSARLQPGRLRLHHLHRQQRPAARRDVGEISERGLVVASVLSGNRNFEGRIQQDVRANYLASPPLVVAYALAGSMNVDLTTEPLGTGSDGKPVYLKDIWPTEQEIQQTMLTSVTADAFRQQYASVFEGDERWQKLPVPTGDRFAWEDDSTYIRKPPFLENLSMTPAPLDRPRRRARAGGARRQHHHRSHLAGRQHQGRQPGGQVPDRARRRAEGLQLLRRAARQPRGDDARHVRQHAHQEPDGAGHRRRRHRRTCRATK